MYFFYQCYVDIILDTYFILLSFYHFCEVCSIVVFFSVIVTGYINEILIIIELLTLAN